jgi:xanthine dehydrogenase accessory factor
VHRLVADTRRPLSIAVTVDCCAMESQSWLETALTLLDAHRAFVLATVVSPAEHPLAGQHVIIDTIDDIPPSRDDIALAEATRWLEVVRSVYTLRSARLESFTIGRKNSADEPATADVFLTYCGPPPEAWLFGAGHIAQALAPLLSTLGWNVVVCDDRAEYVSEDRFPNVSARHAGAFLDSAQACAQRNDVWAVLVTRGHQHDIEILRTLAQNARPEEPHYTGMIGSKRRVNAVRKQMTEQGVSPDFLAKLHAPIGLPIGADSPQEIAIAIAAEMIAVRRGRRWEPTADGGTLPKERPPHLADTRNRTDLWRRAMAEIESGRSVALATIVERRGSTPRGAGTQMLVFGNGSFAGTIGGGCGENIVLHKARELLLREERNALLDLDLTGTDPSDCADTCGGRYKVFLERLP